MSYWCLSFYLFDWYLEILYEGVARSVLMSEEPCWQIHAYTPSWPQWPIYCCFHLPILWHLMTMVNQRQPGELFSLLYCWTKPLLSSNFPGEYTAAKSLQSCPTLCDPIDGSPPGSAVPGILQARTLEWVAISFSNAWKWKLKVKLHSRVRLFSTPWTAAYQAPPSMGFSRQEYWSGVPLPSPGEYTCSCKCPITKIYHTFLA